MKMCYLTESVLSILENIELLNHQVKLYSEMTNWNDSMEKVGNLSSFGFSVANQAKHSWKCGWVRKLISTTVWYSIFLVSSFHEFC